MSGWICNHIFGWTEWKQVHLSTLLFILMAAMSLSFFAGGAFVAADKKFPFRATLLVLVVLTVLFLFGF